MSKPDDPVNSISVDLQKIEGDFEACNELRTGLKLITSMDFSTEMAGASFGVYGLAYGYGDAGTWGVHDIVGVHATAVKQGQFWAAALHADVYDTVGGGTSIGLNIEFPLTQPETNTIGVNIQPFPEARKVIGIQMQHPECFAHGLLIPNMNWSFGQVDECTFGMRFNVERQSLEFFRWIGHPDETKVGEIKMDFGQRRPPGAW